MRYFKVQWTDATGSHLSDPITTWVDAELYRLAIGGDAQILRF